MFMQKLLLVLLIYQQFVCHGCWATRTNVGAAAVPSSTPSPTVTVTPLMVSAAEATNLLTTRILQPTSAQMQQQWKRQRQRQLYVNDNEILTSASASASTAAEAVVPQAVVPVASRPVAKPNAAAAAAATAKSRYKIVSIKTNCTRDLFEMHIELNRSFRGLLYAKDFPFECRSRGNARTNVTLRLPTSGCGVRSEPRVDGLELSVRIMVQMEEKLRQSSDIIRTIRCKLPLNAMGMTLIPGSSGSSDTGDGSAGVASKQRKSSRNGRMRLLVSNKDATGVMTSPDQATQIDGAAVHIASLPPASVINTTTSSSSSSSVPTSTNGETASTITTPRVRIWLELGGRDGAGAVEVGQATTLTVRAIVPGMMGVRVVDCAALDGLGESMQLLLDERGCPIDEQVMPALHTDFKPAEEGWSKQHENDPIEKTFTATFPAFKFPDRERLHVSCGVQLCKGRCPNINCRSADNLILTNDEHLARIEVFNSLAVTAPQIEVDRLRYDRHYNMSVEEYPPYIRPLHSEGTLCLSVSKLALSFCVLGFIFLIAVVVAICSLIRSRQRSVLTGCSSTSTHSPGIITRPEICTSMFSSSSESANSARFGSKLFIPYYPNTLPYGRVY